MLELLQQGLQVLYLLTSLGVCQQTNVPRAEGQQPELAIVCFQADFRRAFDVARQGQQPQAPQAEPPRGPTK